MNDVPVVMPPMRVMVAPSPEISPLEKLERAADHIARGNKNDANDIYKALLNNEQQSDDVLFTATQQYVKLSLATTNEEENIVYQFASYSLNVKNNYADNASYSLKQKHIKINVELANSYESIANELVLFSVASSSNLFSYASGEYLQALCITHLAIASEVGDARSSLRLANLCQEGKYLLPADVNKENLVASYAYLAEAQAQRDNDDHTLFLLGQFHKKNGLSKGWVANATRCYEVAAELGNAEASLVLAKLYYEQDDKVRSAEYSELVIRRQHLTTMLEHGEWCLTRTFFYTDQDEIDLARRSLNGITGFKGLKEEDLARYPKLLKLSKTLQELRSCVAAANHFQLVIHSNTELHLYLTLVSAERNKRAFMLDNNGFFIQLLVAGFSSKDNEIRNKTVQLYHEYMNLKELARCKREITFTGYLDETVKENVEKNLEEISKISLEDDNAFVLANIDDQGKISVLAVSGQFIANIWDLESSTSWEKGIFSENYVAMPFEPTHAYSLFPLTREAYQAANNSLFCKLLEVIDFDFKNSKGIKGTEAFNYAQLFKEAMKYNRQYYPLTELTHQIALAEIVNPLLDEKYGITHAHHDALCNAFGVDRVNDRDQAIMLFMLGYDCTYMSSAYMFGIDGESPNALRNLAKGYLTKAYALVSSVFFKEGEGYLASNQFKIWMANYNGEDTNQCTQSMSNQMRWHYKDKGYEKFAKRYIPLPWR